MWLAKMRVLHENCLVEPLCVKHKVIDYVYLVNAYEKGGYFYYTEIHVIEGDEKSRQNFLSDIRKIPTIKIVLPVGNTFFTLNKEILRKKYYAPFFDRSLFQNKPIILKPDGYEYWEFASWDKKRLINLIKNAPKVFKIELTSLAKIKKRDIYLTKLFPDLTDRQRKCLHLAIEFGYYSTPKKIDMEKLARKTGISRQTFQEHLHRAERKVLEFFFENI